MNLLSPGSATSLVSLVICVFNRCGLVMNLGGQGWMCVETTLLEIIILKPIFTSVTSLL